MHLRPNEEPTVQRVCRDLNPDQQLITLFSENYVPVNCRSSLEGVWQFAYQVRYCLQCKTKNLSYLLKYSVIHEGSQINHRNLIPVKWIESLLLICLVPICI